MATPNGSNRNLKELLAEWKLENIFTHLSAEQIDVDILEMMKLPHVQMLMHNFPLGVQIRFEYNLERWRRDNGRPLQLYTYEERYQQNAALKPKTTTDILKQPSQMQSKITQTDLMILDTNTHENTGKINEISTSSRQSNHSNSSTSANKPFTIKSCVSLPPENNAIDSNSCKPEPCTSKAQDVLPNKDLCKILTLVPYGIELINSYRERKYFTNSERRQLISVIVNYYLDNNIKFTLETSYAIERSILQLFPNEKLDSYRTSKHGKLYSKYLTVKSAKEFLRGDSDPNDNSDMDYGSLAEDDDFSMDNFSDDSQMLLKQNTADTMSQLDDENDSTFMENNEYAVDFIRKDVQPTIIEGEIKPVTKIDPGKATEKPSLQTLILSTELLYNRRRPLENEGQFQNFHVPWHKVPSDIISMLEKQEKLGKRLNALTNLFVDELRSICPHVPMRIFRNVTQQVITKYPFSFLDKDSEGNIISSSAAPLLQRMRDRNNFLNRSRNRHKLFKSSN